MKSVHLVHAGSSTFGQTLFNTVAILLGIGMLSEPLAFACAGWVGGSALLFFYGILTCYTAKVLGKIMHTDPRIRSYSDVARKAFGPRATPFISTLFVLELFAVSIALVTLYADSLHSIVPIHSASTYKLIGAVILIPTTFMPLRLLSFTSFVGILSTIFIVIVLFIDGLAKKTSPGSLWEPAKTSIGPTSFGELGIAFGEYIRQLSFSGHAVIPSLARDMQDPSQFDTMVDWAFAAATVIYFLIGAAGYRMFGHSVYDEVSRNLISTPGYNSTLNRVALWTLVISPLSKFALTTRPVNYTLEIMLGLESFATTDEHRIKPLSAIQHTRHLLSWRQFFIALERIGFTLCSIIVSILVPEFSAMMAFLGAFSAFMLCVIGTSIAPLPACSVMDAAIIITGVVMAAWGTGAAIWSTG
ncbi:hypothetical protein PUNSTDRAFT_58584 [Punctularia strigosozonata HHB-11173 SS5]|uniref:uncharacterized protein n=1 Tax=Punctularia strigosozonata (strain HHB-11173) TaxID=741275 RepID=UPI0004417F7C|nr:uncharacterized protein PUNSTDRAFT_58584 [Punctularia strigosozonata HHB-11173 SS5]EIN13513.1 hypothetical protein PUNSTDRAFT_58584 [Punctularia strigosozonata HHB-11173 SS5]